MIESWKYYMFLDKYDTMMYIPLIDVLWNELQYQRVWYINRIFNTIWSRSWKDLSVIYFDFDWVIHYERRSIKNVHIIEINEWDIPDKIKEYFK